MPGILRNPAASEKQAPVLLVGEGRAKGVNSGVTSTQRHLCNHSANTPDGWLGLHAPGSEPEGEMPEVWNLLVNCWGSTVTMQVIRIGHERD